MGYSIFEVVVNKALQKMGCLKRNQDGVRNSDALSLILVRTFR